MSKKTILFLCTGNSCRSQMAEGWTRQLRGDRYDVYSAGIDPHGLDSRAVRIMAEAGADISNQRSKDVSELMDIPFDYVVTLCDNAHENCPFFPGGARILHAGFPDPPTLAKDASSEEEILGHYRRVRDDIRSFVEALPRFLEEQSRQST